MEILIVLVVVLAGAFLLGGLFGWIAFFQNVGLRNDVNALKKQVVELGEARPEAKPVPKAENSKVEKQKIAAKSTVAEPAVKSAKTVRIVPDFENKPDKPKPDSPSEAVVFTSQNQEKLTKWFAENWAYALGALSLSLAGIYIVRLGMENGYFPPVMRILSGVSFGVILIAVAEWLRKRGGDEKGSLTEYIPSTVASAGFATLFAAVLGAQTLYGLISETTSFFGLAIIAVFAIVAGWRFGALLSAFGVAGAFLAPLMVGQSTDTSYIMFAYTLLVLGMTLAVDTVKRTGWLSVWAMVASFGFGFLIYSGKSVMANADVFGISYLGFGLAFLVLCTILPDRKLTPSMGKSGIIEHILNNNPWPSFPARLVGGAMLANIAIFGIVVFAWPLGFWMIMIYVSLLAAICFFWLSQSEVLEEYALVPLGMTLFLLFTRMSNFEVSGTQNLLSVCMLGLVLALMCALAAKMFKQLNSIWRYVSIGYPFIFALLLMMNWSMGSAMPYWQLIVGAYGGLTAYLAYHYSRKLGRNAQVVDIAIIAVWGYVAMLAWSYLQGLPLVNALALIVVPLTFGVLKMNWRFHELATKIWTGLFVCFAFSETLIGGWVELAVLAALTAGAIWLYFQCKIAHPKLRIHFEAWGFVLASVTIAKLLYLSLDAIGVTSMIALAGLIFIVLLAQVAGIRHRMKIDDGALYIRKIMLGLYVLATGAVASVLIVMLPVYGDWLSEGVSGLPVINDMLIGYLAPALALIAIHKYQPWPKIRLDYVGYGIAVVWLIMVVRHFWQGDSDISMDQPTGSGELYTYTVMMLLGMSGAMAKAVKERSVFWRRVAYALIILTSIKLYFVDLAQFEGVLRVVALLVFGVILIGFNFIDRKSMVEQSEN